MATTITCDKCGEGLAGVRGKTWFMVHFYYPGESQPVTDEQGLLRGADLCAACAGRTQGFMHIQPLDPKEPSLPEEPPASSVGFGLCVRCGGKPAAIPALLSTSTVHILDFTLCLPCYKQLRSFLGGAELLSKEAQLVKEFREAREEEPS